MRKHNALGLSGTSGSVKNPDDIRVDDPVAGLRRHGKQFAPAAEIQPIDSRQGFGGVNDHDMPQVAASRQGLVQQGEALR